MSNLLLGLTFLVIGDSHLATQRFLISTLHDALLAEGAQVDSFGACGVPAGAWVAPREVPCGSAQRIGTGPVKENRTASARSWSVDQLIQQVHPSVVVVEIGDTMAGYSQKELPRNWINENVTALTTRIRANNLPCVWVGPSWGTEGGPFFKTYARVKELSDYLKSILTTCTYIDSLAMAQPGQWPTFDGQHHTYAGYQQWGQAITTALNQSAVIKALEKH